MKLIPRSFTTCAYPHSTSLRHIAYWFRAFALNYLSILYHSNPIRIAVQEHCIRLFQSHVNDRPSIDRIIIIVYGCRCYLDLCLGADHLKAALNRLGRTPLHTVSLSITFLSCPFLFTNLFRALNCLCVKFYFPFAVVCLSCVASPFRIYLLSWQPAIWHVLDCLLRLDVTPIVTCVQSLTFTSFILVVQLNNVTLKKGTRNDVENGSRE